MKASHLKTGAAVAGILIILLVMVWVRAFVGSMRAWDQGEALLKEKKYVEAITFFDRSMHWYTPYNPYVEKSAHRLWEIGVMAEKKGDVTLALIAYRTIRRGFYGTEGIYSPGKAWIEKSEAKIGSLVKHGGAARAGALQKRLVPPPNIFWSVMVEVGLLGWLATMVILVIRLFKRDQGSRVKVASCMGWGVLSLCFFALWVIGLLKA